MSPKSSELDRSSGVDVFRKRAELGKTVEEMLRDRESPAAIERIAREQAEELGLLKGKE